MQDPKLEELARPHYQGKLDNFCAMYAVINGLKYLKNISSMQAKVVLTEALHFEAKDAAAWLKVLNHETDYHKLVLRMSQLWQKMYNYKHFLPFPPEEHGFMPLSFFQEEYDAIRQNVDMKKPEITKDALWQCFMENTVPSKRVVIFRLCRFVPGQVGPLVDHWTTIGQATKDTLYFYDCSLEKTGWYVVPKERVFVAPFYSLPAQTLGFKNNLTLNLNNEEFAVIPPEHVHVLHAL